MNSGTVRKHVDQRPLQTQKVMVLNICDKSVEICKKASSQTRRRSLNPGDDLHATAEYFWIVSHTPLMMAGYMSYSSVSRKAVQALKKTRMHINATFGSQSQPCLTHSENKSQFYASSSSAASIGV